MPITAAVVRLILIYGRPYFSGPGHGREGYGPTCTRAGLYASPLWCLETLCSGQQLSGETNQWKYYMYYALIYEWHSLYSKFNHPKPTKSPYLVGFG